MNLDEVETIDAATEFEVVLDDGQVMSGSIGLEEGGKS